MIWAFVLLFSFQTVRAQDISEVTQILQKAIAPEIECTPDTLDEKTLQECAQDVCGKPGSVPSAFVTGSELDGYVMEGEVKVEFDRSIELLTQAGNDWMLNVLNTLKGFEAYVDQNPDELDPTFYNLFYVLNRYVSYQVKDNDIKVVPQFPADMDENLKKGIREWMTGKQEEAKTDPLLRMRLGLNSPKDSMTILKENWEKLKIETDALPADNAIRLEYEKSLPEVQTLIDRSSSEFDVYGVNNYIVGFKAKLHPVDAAKSKELGVNIFEPSCKAECLNAVKPLLNKAPLKKAIKALRDRLDEDFKNYMEGCAAAMGIQAKHGQLPGQREKALALVDSALEKVTALPWWSEHTKEHFKKFVKEQAQVAHQFNSEKVITKENLIQNRNMTNNKLHPQVFIDTLLKAENSNANTFGQAIPFCPSPNHTLNDSFQFTLNKPILHVSPYSCDHPEIGEGIVAHELGHGLSTFMNAHADKSPESAKKYQEIRKCINQQSPDQSLILPDQVMLAFPGDTLTGEEDTADWLSFNGTTPGTPVSCSFLPVKDNAYDPRGLKLKPAQNDSHSAGFLRAIRQIMAQKQSLSVACQKVVNAYKGIVEVGICQ